MRNCILLLFLISAVFACKGQNEAPGDSSLTPAQAQEKMAEKKVVCLDVRTPEEYNKGHLPGARQINYYDRDFVEQLEALPKDWKYIVYCHSGGRSSKTVQLMRDKGFTRAYNLLGGISEWQKKGKTIAK